MEAFAPRYARAFAQVATAAGLDPAAAQQQLSGFAGLLAESRELREVLENPAIPTPQKNNVLDALASRLQITGPVRNFIAVIMDHQRLGALDEIRSEYEVVAAAGQHIAEAAIESAHPLDEAERNALQSRTQQLAGGDVRLSWSENPALLGGAIIRIGSKVYDGSLRAQLDEMKRQLLSAPLVGAGQG